MLITTALALTAIASHRHSVRFFIGTYTSRHGSRGIYEAQLDTRTGVISHLALAAEAHNPSYLAVHPNGRFLYAVDETSKGSVSSYAVGKAGGLTPINTQPLSGSDPAHLSVDRHGKYLLSACYSGGIVTSQRIKRDGSIGATTGIVDNAGHGPDKDRQAGPHMHWIASDPLGRYVYSCDLGTDLVQRYRLQPRTGKLIVKPPDAVTTPGGGPRHGAFHPFHRFLYVNDEMGSNVVVFAVQPRTGLLRKLQVISSLPAGDAVRNTTAEIECHPNGRWLYVSNRGDDSIAVYRILGSGRLKLVEVRKLGVKEPRGFSIDPTGKWLVTGGQNSNVLAVFSINSITGRLTPTGQTVSIGSPVCIVFAQRRSRP